MVNKYKFLVAGVASFLILSSLSAKANMCSDLFESSSKGPNLIEVIQMSNPLQNQFNKLQTALEQTTFIQQRMTEGYELVEIIVGTPYKLHEPQPYNPGINMVREFRYFLVDSIKNTTVIVDLTKNKFVTRDKFGHMSRPDLGLSNDSKTIEYFSGVLDSAWTPKDLTFPARIKFGISHYENPIYWKIDNPVEFKDVEPGSFYLNVYQTDVKFELDTIPTSLFQRLFGKKVNDNQHKIRKLDKDL